MTRREGFRRPSRVRRPVEFKRIFARGLRVRSGPFLAVFVPVAGEPRLGTAISKRHAPQAVERNRIKRQLREHFRVQSVRLPRVDCVITLISPTAKSHNSELRAHLGSLWLRVRAKCSTCSSS